VHFASEVDMHDSVLPWFLVYIYIANYNALLVQSTVNIGYSIVVTITGIWVNLPYLSYL